MTISTLSSKRDLMALPVPLRKFFGHALDFAQHGDKHDAAKVLKGFGSAGVLEIVEDGRGGTYRAFTRSNSRRRYSCCMYFRKKAGTVLPRPNRTLTSSANT